MKVAILSIIIHMFIMIHLLPSMGFAKALYVSRSDGSDSNSGRNITTAFKTIRRAAKTATAGDTVYIRAGRYTGQIKLTRSGREGQPITFTNYEDEIVTLIGTTKKGGPTLHILGDYITVDGLHSKLFNPCQGKGNNQFNFEIKGDYVSIQNCRFEGTDGLKDWLPPCNGREGGIVVAGAKHTDIHNNYFSELSFQGIKFLDRGREVASHWRVRENETVKLHSNGVFIESQLSTLQHGLIENNKFTGSMVSDGIQCNGIYKKKNADPTNFGVVIQNNIITNNAENGIDLKGTRYYIIQNNIIQGNIGDNDGFQDGKHDTKAFGAISRGTHTKARDHIIRGNIIYDNHSGANTFEGYRVFNNTFINNNRDYSGPSSRKNADKLIGISASFYADVKLINNLIGGHNGCDILINPARENNFIDHNFYTSDMAKPKLCAWLNGEIRNYDFGNWQTFLSRQSIKGKDRHSMTGSPKFLKASSQHHGWTDNPAFEVTSDSLVIDKGGPLTTTTTPTHGKKSTVLPVEDSQFFTDGMDTIDGDTIMVADQIVKVENIENQILHLDRAISWSLGDGVIWCPQHECPADGQIDIGAVQYKKQKQ